MTECSMVHKEHLAVTQAEDWLILLNINLELSCQLEPKTVVQKIKANIK